MRPSALKKAASCLGGPGHPPQWCCASPPQLQALQLPFSRTLVLTLTPFSRGQQSQSCWRHPFSRTGPPSSLPAEPSGQLPFFKVAAGTRTGLELDLGPNFPFFKGLLSSSSCFLARSSRCFSALETAFFKASKWARWQEGQPSAVQTTAFAA